MRKRHVSNDMVLVVFQESRTDHFAFDTIISRQTHIVILVTPIATKKDDQPSIRVQLFKRCGCAVIPAYARWDQEPLVIGNEDDRNRFLATGKRGSAQGRPSPLSLSWLTLSTVPMLV